MVAKEFEKLPNLVTNTISYYEKTVVSFEFLSLHPIYIGDPDYMSSIEMV